MALGPGSIALIVGAGLLVFGPKKLPELGKSLGETLREFKKATAGLVSNDEEELEKQKETVKSTVSPTIKVHSIERKAPHYKITRTVSENDDSIDKSMIKDSSEHDPS